MRKLLEMHNHRVLRRDYNPKAGILPSSKDEIGNRQSTSPSDDEEIRTPGLKQFVDRAELGKFIGPVSLKLIPENMTRSMLLDKLERRPGPRTPVVLVVEDHSMSVVALASETVRQKLYHLLSETHSNNNDDTLKAITNGNMKYSATVRSVDWDNKRYFVLNDLLTIQDDD